MPQNPSAQQGTPTGTTLATTLVESGVITGTQFGLGLPHQEQDVVASDTSKTSRHPIAAQRIVYGLRGKLAGVETYRTISKTTYAQEQIGVDDSDNGNIHMVHTFAGHEIDGFYGGYVTDVHGVTNSVPLIIYLDGFPVPLTVNGAEAFGGGSGYVSFLGITISGSFAPADGGYYVPWDYKPPKLPNGQDDKAHDFRNRIRVEISTGDPSSSSQPFPLLASDTITGNPGSWDSTTALQRGCAKAHIQLIWDATRFNNGIPHISFDIGGKKVYDPRLSPPGYAFSSNSALILRDWLTDTKFGLGVDPSLINDTLIIAAANACDEAMALREGGTQPRYTCNGVFDASMEKGQVLQKILDSMMGILIPPGKQWKLYAGKFRDSVVSITDKDLRGPIKMDTAVSRRDLANIVKGTFISPDNGWTAADFPPYANSTYVVDDGGTVTSVSGHNVYTGLIYADMTLDFVTDSVQAQRLAKIKLEILRRKSPLILPCKMVAFEAEAGDTIEFTHTRWGLSAATYLVTNTALVRDENGGAPVMGYDLVCIPWDSNVFEWDADVDEGTVTIVTAPLLPDNSNVGAPTGVGSPPVLGLESDSSTTITRADGIAHSQIKVTWTAPTDAHVLNGGYIEIFIKKVSDADTAYVQVGSVAGNLTQYYIDQNITDGIDYDVKIQSLNAAGSHSDPLTGSIVCSGDASTISGGSSTSPGPINIANNDFEASSAIPPASWSVKGSPTLAYEISSQQQGIRSLKITSSVVNEGVYTTQKYEVVPGDTFTGESYKVGGYIKGDGTGHGIIALRWFDASGTEVGTPVVADGGTPTPATWTFYSATGLVDPSAVYCQVFLQNKTGSSNTLEFDSIFLTRIASMEDEVANGPTRGAITAANSSYRPLSNPLTAHDDGATCEIDIASFIMRTAMGPTDISINSGVITGLAHNTTYHVYYDDPSYSGGAVSYFANTTQAIALDATGRFYVGSINTPTAGGVDTVGNNDGGTGAQSGQLYWLSPTLRADLDAESGVTLWSPAFAEDTDGDTGGTPVNLSVVDTIYLGGWVPPSKLLKWTSLKLKIVSQLNSVDTQGAAFADYSVDDGDTWTNIFNVANGASVLNNVTAGANSGSGTAWTNPSYIDDPINYATITGAAHGTTSQYDKATGLGNAIPSGSVINGIKVNFAQIVGGSAVAAGETGQFKVQLLKAGTPVGTVKTVNGNSGGTLELGGNDDLWGTTWADVDPNDTNFGFEVAAVAPVSASAWVAGEYYSPLAIIKDSNGNLQQVVTGGTSGGSHPTWSTTLSATTTDGPDTLVWVCLQKSTTMTWASGQDVTAGGWRGTGDPNDPTNTGHFIVATAGGVSCLFELTPGNMPRLGDLTAYVWSSTSSGAFNKSYPSVSGTILSPPSLHVSTDNPVGSHSVPYNIHFWPVNGDGTLGSPIDTGYYENWEMAVVGQIYFAKAGTYYFNLSHDDGAMIGFDTQVVKVSGTVVNDAWGPRTAVKGYTYLAGNNNSGYYPSEPFVIKILHDATTVNCEINWTNWEHRGDFILTCKDATGVYQELVPISANLKTGSSTPTWPAWSTAYKPSWPSVTESAGNLVWVNRGPISDMAWIASTVFTTAGLEIVDGNGYGQKAYRAGVSGGSAPSFSTSLNGLTTDGSTLTWRNDGTRSTVTTFDFSIGDGSIEVAYTPPSATSSRAKTTDTISLNTTQTLGNVQLRYGLADEAGSFDVYEVWIEGQAG